MTNYELVKGVVIATTDDAVLIEQPSSDEKWIPRSVIENGDEIEEDECDLSVATWFVNKEGL